MFIKRYTVTTGNHTSIVDDASLTTGKIYEFSVSGIGTNYELVTSTSDSNGFHNGGGSVFKFFWTGGSPLYFKNTSGATQIIYVMISEVPVNADVNLSVGSC